MNEQDVVWTKVGALEHCLPAGKHDIQGATYDTANLSKEQLETLLAKKSPYVRKAQKEVKPATEKTPETK